MEKVIKNLENRGYNVFYFETKEEARDKILSLISKNDLLGFGGSKTTQEVGLLPYLLENGYNALNRFDQSLSAEEIYEIERQSLLSDIFITSTNAISKNGELVNMDGKSNRVAAQIFGPKQVFIVTGVNKICDTLDEAVDRVKNYASPKNAQRFKDVLKTGCANSEKCVECVGSDTICKTFVITRRAQKPNRTSIFLINEELGF